MKRVKSILAATMIVVLTVCAVFCAPVSVRAEGWEGKLQTASGVTTFYGAKNPIEFVLPVPREWSFRNENKIDVKIYKSGKQFYSKSVEITEDEWNDQKVNLKLTLKKTGSFKISVGDQSFKFKIKKGSAIKSYKPALNIEDKTIDSQRCIVLSGLDVGTKAKIYRQTGFDGKLKLLKTVSKGEYIDKDVKLGTLYYYQVQYIVKEGKQTYTSKKSEMQGLS